MGQHHFASRYSCRSFSLSKASDKVNLRSPLPLINSRITSYPDSSVELMGICDLLRKLLCAAEIPDEDDHYPQRRQTAVHYSDIFPTIYPNTPHRQTGSISGPTLKSGSGPSLYYTARTDFSRPFVNDLSDIYETWSVCSVHSRSRIPNICVMQ